MVSSLKIAAVQAATLLSLAAVASAVASADDCLSYSITITDCDPEPTAVTVQLPAVTEVKTVTVVMPACHVCAECKADHDKCAVTKTYVTVLDAVCKTGLTKTTYTVEEIYPGVTGTPALQTNKADCPAGFTTSAVTCHECGPNGVTKTITYPTNGQPIQTAAPNGNGNSGSGSGSGSGNGSGNGNGNGAAVVTAGAAKSGAQTFMAAVAAVFFFL